MNPLEQLHEELTRTYGSVFVAYQRAHIAHINTRSRNFYSDHKLLKHIYEFLQDTIDVVGEKIQSCGLGGVPTSIQDTMDLSSVMDLPVEGDADELLHTVWEDINTLIIFSWIIYYKKTFTVHFPTPSDGIKGKAGNSHLGTMRLCFN